MSKMKNPSTGVLHLLVLVVAFLLVPSLADAQGRTGRRGQRTSRTTAVRQSQLKAPSAPTPIGVRERTIQDLLFFPFGSLTGSMKTQEEAEQQITAAFGQCESINHYPGLHAHDTFDFSYRGVPLGLAYYDWSDNRMWYVFYFEAKADADRFFNNLSNDIKGAGIPLTLDRIYGDMSNRNRPVSIFEWVYVSKPEKVKITEGTNIDSSFLEGWYKVEFGVYKR